MTIPNIKNALVVSFFLSFPHIMFSQLQKGTQNFDGELSYDKYNITAFNIHSSHVAFTPTYGVFLSDKFLLSGRFSAYFNKYNRINNDRNIGLNLWARYYINPKKKWRFFGQVELGFNQYVEIKKHPSFQNDIVSGLNYHIYVGANRFLNDEIAVEARLGFGNTLDFNYNQITDVPTVKGSSGIYIGLNNFVTNPKDNDYTGLTAKNRKVIGGSLAFNVSFPYTFDAFLILDADYGVFAAEHLLLGGHLNVTKTSEIEQTEVATYFQYFVPVSKRFLFQMKAQAGLIYSSPQEPDRRVFYGKVGLGGLYFISKKVAINADALSFSQNSYRLQNYKLGHLSSNLRLLYFLK